MLKENEKIIKVCFQNSSLDGFDKFKTRLFNAYPNLILTNKKFGSFLKKNLGKFKKKINW